MASLHLVPNQSPEVIAPQQSLDVPVLDYELRAAAKMYRQATMRIAYFAVRLRYALMDDWGPVKVADEEAYRKSLGIGYSTWMRCMKIGHALFHIRLADMEKIAVGNAELLLKVEPALWHDFPWVQEAQKLPADALAQLIVQRHKQVGSKAEPLVYFRVQVPHSVKQFLIDTIETFRQEYDIATTGEALEALIAGRKTKRGFDVETDEEKVHSAKGGSGIQDYNRWFRDVPFEPSRAHGEEASDYASFLPAKRGMRAMRSDDDFDGDDDRLEE